MIGQVCPASPLFLYIKNMTKVYILNQEKNNAVFILYGKGGNAARYTFKDGNVNFRQPAKLILKNEYYQNLLENSELFKKNIVKLDPTFNSTPKEEVKKVLTPIKDVKSVAQAVEYCAEHFGEVVKSSKQAKACAEKNGFDFVNLIIKE